MTMFKQAPRYLRAGEAAVKILSDHFDPKRPRGELYFEIMAVIVTAMETAEEERAEIILMPSRN
jgi:hypothetical protein